MSKQENRYGFLDNGGSTGRRIGQLDWSRHPIGPIEAWDATLRTSLGIVLASSFPTFLAWGEGLTLFFNDAYEPMLGQKGDSLGAPYQRVWHEVWDTLAPYIRRVLDGESFFFENYATTLARNGYPEPAWFTFSYSPVRDETGQVRGLICTCVDVTEKVQALARHKEAEERLALSLEASGNIGTWSYDLDDGATFVDERFARLFQVDAALARTGTELERFTDMIHPADRPRVVAAIETAIRQDSLYDIEYRIPQRSGQDVWVNARGKVFADPATGRRRFAGVAVDITARLATARALSESEQKFRGIANVIPQMVWSSNIDGTEHYVNERWHEFTGVTESALAGRGWRQVVHPDDWAPIQARWKHSFSGNVLFEAEHRLAHHADGYRWVLNRALPSFDDEGRVTHWIGTLTDIHDQKAGADELRAAARRKDDFLAMLAHELRNPLAPISNAAQLLTMAGADDQRIRRSSEVIIRQVRHMTELVDDLLDVSRVTRGLVALEREPVDIGAVVSGAIEQARPLIDARGHHFELTSSGPAVRILGDRTRLVQVLANLLNNAAKYTPQGGRIGLSVAARDGLVTLEVSDNGIGIDSAMLPHLFDLFSQAERTPDRSQGGLGLGLALVNSLVQLHGGRVEAHSAGLGRGSIFRLVFDIAATKGQARAADVAEHDETPGAPAPGRRVLVVDDNIDAAQSLADVLRALGHAVSTSHAPGAALALAAADWPEVFILDIGLPDIDGYELVRRLRALAGARPTRYVALTGYGQAHDKVLARGAGFDHHFVKPVDLEALCRVLDAPAP